MKQICYPLPVIATIGYLVLVLGYFGPIHAPSKIAYPLAFLTLCGLHKHPKLIVGALFCSCIGDFMGSLSCFVGQLSAFACCHMFLIAHLIKQPSRKTAFIDQNSLLVINAILFTILLIIIEPSIETPLYKGLVAFYALLIITMLYLAETRGGWMLTTGALLFVFSDSVLGYNRFVEKVPYSSYWILISYFTAQYFIYTAFWRKQKEDSTCAVPQNT